MQDPVLIHVLVGKRIRFLFHIKVIHVNQSEYLKFRLRVVPCAQL